MICQKVCHEVKTHHDVKKFVITSKSQKVRHDIKNMLRCQKVRSEVKKLFMMSKTRHDDKSFVITLKSLL